MKKLILTLGLLLSTNLWAFKLNYAICTSIDVTKTPKHNPTYLEKCVSFLLDNGYVLYGDPLVDSKDVIIQALVLNEFIEED